MFEWDVVIVGGGPAGLTAGLYLGRASRRVVLIDKESAGGYIKNIELLENYPGFAEGVAGAHLASQMLAQASKYGLQVEMGEVSDIELFSSCRVVSCVNGMSYTTAVVILASGSTPMRLGVPGEEELLGKGVFTCAFCDGGEFSGRTVAVCGGGDSGVTGALYMSKIASKVYLLEAMPRLTATAILQERVKENPKIDVRVGTRVEAILGKEKVESVELAAEGGKKQTLDLDGVLVHIGLIPNTGYVNGKVPLDDKGQVIVNGKMESEVPYILAAGDIRSGSPRQVSAAVGDGAIAAITAERLLQELA